jgi:serine/threonine protein kinase
MDFGQVVSQQYNQQTAKYDPIRLPRDPVGKPIYYCPEMCQSLLDNLHPCTQRQHHHQQQERQQPRSSAASNVYNAQAVDIWQLGILMFIVLTGQPPFQMSSSATSTCTMRDNYMKKQAWWIRIKHRTIESMPIIWRNHTIEGIPCSENYEEKRLYECISSSAMKLLSQLLEIDPEKRPSMEEVLQHEWFHQ